MKRTLSFALCLVMLLSLCACGLKRPSAQSVVEDTINSIISPEAEFCGFYGTDNYGVVSDESNETDSTEDGLSNETYQKMIQNISYTVISASEDEEAGTAVVTVEITNINLGDVMITAIGEVFNYMLEFIFMPEDQQPSDEETSAILMASIEKSLDDPNVATITTTVDVSLKLVEDLWVIDNNYELGDALYGKLLSSMDSLDGLGSNTNAN